MAILKQQQRDQTIIQIACEHGISEATFYNWKQKYGGMEASELKRLRDLEEENRRLKKMYAELSLDHEIVKEALRKKWYGLLNVVSWPSGLSKQKRIGSSAFAVWLG